MSTKRHALVAGAAAVLLAAGTATVITVTSQGSASGAKAAHLASSTCTGPAGAAYVALAGFQAFDAIDTDNCTFIQDYNVGDPQVPGDSGDYNYAGTDEAVAIHGDTLYFAAAVAGKHIPAAATASTASRRPLINRLPPRRPSCAQGA